MITVRNATVSDFESLRELIIHWPNGSRLRIRGLGDDEENPAIFDGFLRDAVWHLLVASLDGTLVGYALAYDVTAMRALLRRESPAPSLRSALLDELLVSPDYQGMGVGRTLVLAFERWAVSIGCQEVELAGGPAHEFYERIGYVREPPLFHYRKRLEAPREAGGA